MSEKRYESTELTIVSPRSSLPPVSTTAGPTLEQLVTIERAMQDATETLVSCPACAGCLCCHDRRMVSAERSAEYRRVAALTACVPVDDPEPEAA